MKKIKIQSLLYLYIILCPILDCASFIFRNALGTNISPSTFIRPIFVIIACLYIFITDKKQRKIFTIAGLAYGIYAAVHLYIFTLVKNNSSYSGIIHELQYLVNYTFMVLNLYVYLYVFTKNKKSDELNKCILISTGIYIISIYIAILTGTSSHTYTLDGIGYKGWFESGNSLSAILILYMFILLNIFKNKKISKNQKIYTAIIIGLISLFLVSLIGTKVGLFGVALVFALFGISHVIYNIINKRNEEIFTVLDNVMAYYKEKSLYDEFRQELEYIYTRYLLCSSFLRIVKIKDKKIKKDLLNKTWNNLNTKFPNWKQNKILNKSKNMKNLYIKSVNKTTFNMYSKILK